MTTEIYRFNVGACECMAVSDGTFTYSDPATFLFANAPEGRLDQARREFEKQFIVAALRSNEGNLSRSARSLGVHRNTLRNKVSDLGIVARDFASRPSRRRAPRP